MVPLHQSARPHSRRETRGCMQVGDALCQLTHSNMSTSDSDYSIDWLASDEDDPDGSPLLPEEPSSSSSSSSEAAASSCRESPTSCLLSAAQRKRRKRRRSKDGDSALSPVQGFTSVCSNVSVEAELPSNRKRTHKDDAHGADEENQLFSHKCAELQCYIQPLSSILWGLRSGRYSERLSSFQESVAMDRIQRIMGVLQNPGTGGRFLSIILKIEEMLQSWFPHVRANSPPDDSTSTKKLKQHRSAASPPPSASSTSPLPVFYPAAPEAAAVVCSSSSSSRLGVTQDNAVSSSTDSKTGPLHRHKGAPLPLKISSPCLERLLQAKDSIIVSRADGDGVWW